jgi:hypothetical protein
MSNFAFLSAESTTVHDAAERVSGSSLTRASH